MRNTSKILVAVVVLLTIGASSAFADTNWSGTGSGTFSSGSYTVTWSGIWYTASNPDVLMGDWYLEEDESTTDCEFTGEIYPSGSIYWDYELYGGTWKCTNGESPSGTFNLYFVDDHCYGTWTIDGETGTGTLSGSR